MCNGGSLSHHAIDQQKGGDSLMLLKDMNRDFSNINNSKKVGYKVGAHPTDPDICAVQKYFSDLCLFV